ncbi:MAG: hypothetical protein ISS51_02560 [Dehalococcoidales bacterium]|nr:hypothetical protein [Dehalococcoidales bacterium]
MMSKRVKIIVSVVLTILLLTVGITATAMAQEEEPTTTPEAGAKGLLLARVAEILGIPQEDLANAFKQAQQEVREEALSRRLDKAVEEGRITQEEADAIKEWWEQKPDVLGLGLSVRAFGFPALGSGHMWGGHRGCHWPRPPELAD